MKLLCGVVISAAIASGCGGRSGSLGDGDPPDADSDGATPQTFILLVKRDAVGLTRFVNKISDPTSKHYGKLLSSVDDVGSLFGASAATRKTVDDFLINNDATSIKWSPTGGYVFAALPLDRLVELFCGSPLDAKRNEEFVPGCIPPDLLCAVEGVSALPGKPRPSFGVVAPVVLNTPQLPNIDKPGAGGDAAGCAPAKAQMTKGGMTPNEIRTGFGFDDVVSPKDSTTMLFGKGRLIVTLNQATLSETIHAKNASCYSIKELVAPLAIGAYKSSALATPTDTAAGEGDIDTSLAMFMAPAARIQQLVAPAGDGTVAMFYEAVLDKKLMGGVPDVVSSSLGFSPGSMSRTALQISEFALAAGSAIGITYASAAGDSGFSVGDRIYPAVSAFGVGVGGLNVTYTSKNAIDELAVMYIPDSDIGGGGPSSVFERPIWQKGPSTVFGPGLTFEDEPMRMTPDVAMSGNPQVPLFLDTSPATFYSAIGTSSATPIFAAAVALANEARDELGKPPLGRIGPMLYALAAEHYGEAFTDVKRGTGGGDTLDTGKAVTGYDMSTGLGALKVAEFVRLLAAAP